MMNTPLHKALYWELPDGAGGGKGDITKTSRLIKTMKCEKNKRRWDGERVYVR